MFHLIIVELHNEDRVEHFNYAELVGFRTFENLEDAIKSFDLIIEDFVEEYSETNKKKMFSDNVKTFRNVIFETESFVRQFWIVKD